MADTSVTRKKIFVKSLCNIKSLSIASVKTHVRKLLTRLPKTFSVIQGLLEFHIDRRRKFKGGIKSLQFDGKNLTIMRDDMTLDTISYIKCCHWCVAELKLTANKKTLRQRKLKCDQQEAYRNEVRRDTDEFRRRSATHDPKYNDSTKYHVGHDYKRGKRFVAITRDFFGLRQPILKKYNNIWVLKDRNLAEEWRKFHLHNAILQMETALENLKGNRGFKRKSAAI